MSIFFVLSGYVIAYVCATKERTAGEYVVSRVSRLYSVALPALVLTFLFDTLGKHFDPQLYQAQKILWRPESWESYLASALFVNDFYGIGLGGMVPGTNGPFWSLSFEATYYVVAGLALFAPRLTGAAAAIALLAIAGRTVAALLPLWALGFWLFHSKCRLRTGTRAAWVALIVSAAAIVLLPPAVAKLPTDNLGFVFPWGRGSFNRNLLADYLAAMFFAVHVLAARRLANELPLPRMSAASAIRWMGSLTFPLYCIHFPALCFFRAVSPWANNTWANAAFLTIGVFAVVAAVTPLCDLLKARIRASLRPAIARAEGRHGKFSVH